MPKRKELPKIAILLVHIHNRAAFLKQLRELDDVCKGNDQVGLFVYDAAYAQSEHLERNDVIRLNTPLRLLQGTIQSEIGAYNALFKSARYDHQWALILGGVKLDRDWYVKLIPYLSKRQVGLWGGVINNDEGSSTHHELWEQNFRNIKKLHKKQTWVDDRFWLGDLRVVEKLHGFEERFFRGDVAFRDFGWRVLHRGGCVGSIAPLPVSPVHLKNYPMETMLHYYFEVRNQWLFTRLRLTRLHAVLMMMRCLFLDGFGKRKLTRAGYRSGFWDGLRLWF